MERTNSLNFLPSGLLVDDGASHHDVALPDSIVSLRGSNNWVLLSDELLIKRPLCHRGERNHLNPVDVHWIVAEPGQVIGFGRPDDPDHLVLRENIRVNRPIRYFKKLTILPACANMSELT